MIPLSSVAAASNLSPRSPHSSPCGCHSSMFYSVNRSLISWTTRRKRSCDLARASTGGVPPPEAPVRTVALLELGSAVTENRNVAQQMPLQMGKRVSERATRGGEGRNTAVSGYRINVVRLGKSSEPVRKGELAFLALAGRAVRRLGDSAPRWPAGSPGQWQRPRMWICAGPRDPGTPSQAGGGFVWLG